jgi:hypothetical protein
MNSRTSPCAWLLICAFAIGAMASGHAAAVALGGSSGYRHVAQAPLVGIAALCALAGIALVLRRIESSAKTSAVLDPDWVLPALVSIERLGVTRLIPALVGIQLAALFAGEAIELRVAGVSLVGAQALFGSSLAIMPVVHIAIGVFAAVVLWLGARAVCHNIGIAAAFVRRALAWLARKQSTVTASRTARNDRATVRRHLQLAHKIASRPPPLSFIRNA